MISDSQSGISGLISRTERGVSYAVTELLEGETLRLRLAAPISLGQALSYALQVAKGISAAHEKGVVHRDLKPENLFVLPDDAIGYVDFGIVGQLPNRVRDSLTRYSWLLFRGDVEGAVRELMRWLAPGPATDINAARWQLIRVHQAFLYDTVAGRTRVTEGAPGPSRDPTDNPYSRLATSKDFGD